MARDSTLARDFLLDEQLNTAGKCLVCGKKTQRLAASICEECRSAILFVKALKNGELFVAFTENKLPEEWIKEKNNF